MSLAHQHIALRVVVGTLPTMPTPDGHVAIVAESVVKGLVVCLAVVADRCDAIDVIAPTPLAGE